MGQREDNQTLSDNRAHNVPQSIVDLVGPLPGDLSRRPSAIDPPVGYGEEPATRRGEQEDSDEEASRAAHVSINGREVLQLRA